MDAGDKIHIYDLPCVKAPLTSNRIEGDLEEDENLFKRQRIGYAHRHSDSALAILELGPNRRT